MGQRPQAVSHRSRDEPGHRLSAESVQVVVPKSERVRKELITLNPEKKSLIEERIGWKFPEESFEVYIGESGTQTDGYAVVQNTIGKHKPMTYMVGVDNEGSVSNVELLVFRESRGSEVQEEAVQRPV